MSSIDLAVEMQALGFGALRHHPPRGLQRRQRHRRAVQQPRQGFGSTRQAFTRRPECNGRRRAALRRVRRLEEAGVIAGYAAQVVPERVGLGLTAYINVRLEKHTESHKRNPMDVFRASVQGWPEVVECAALAGEMGADVPLVQLVSRLWADGRDELGGAVDNSAIVQRWERINDVTLAPQDPKKD